MWKIANDNSSIEQNSPEILTRRVTDTYVDRVKQWYSISNFKYWNLKIGTLHRNSQICKITTDKMEEIHITLEL